MTFHLKDEQREIVAAIKRFASEDKVLNATSFRDDDLSQFSPEKWRRCSETGLLALPIPKAYGGLGESMLTTALAIKTLSRHCTDEGMVFSICAHLSTCMIPLLTHGTEAQKLEYLPRLAAGELIGGNGSTESEAGSDLSSMRVRIRATDGGYRVDGAKLYVTNGPIASVLILYARHPDGIKYADVSAFIVETDQPGVKVGQVWDKMGLRTSPLSEIVLEDYFVPKAKLLGRERRGLATFNESMLWERIIMPAYHLGSMEQQFNVALERCRTRRQYGERLIQFQGISDKLVAMKRNIDTSAALLHHVCAKHDEVGVSMAEASMLKLHVSSAKIENSLDAVQIFGASGYMKSNIVEKQLRDSIAATIYSGTSEIQRKIIVEEMAEYE